MREILTANGRRLDPLFLLLLPTKCFLRVACWQTCKGTDGHETQPSFFHGHSPSRNA
ncbi:hypothetical protein SCHPADRAFT_279498 [Schizopora paradoxa]|uniref:Uncharacterized protein n=1 Tax=Schizopora paradoxa TaxID=27342 RepID=A0A0H2S018_9AGAM|nr:hypothetical protein SCHPADRAFT_279498 [Schizopora paradoxa]